MPSELARGKRLDAFVGLALLVVCAMPPRTSCGQLPSPPPSTAETPSATVSDEPFPLPPAMQGLNLLRQTSQEAAAKSHGCVVCHQNVHDMHQVDGRPASFHLGCVDCHGGNPTSTVKDCAHVLPRYPQAWTSAANPVRSYTLLNHESPEFVRFVNPGDLRIAHISCGTSGCHGQEVLQVRKSMMTHGCMLWGAALYNNGAFPKKHAHFGESYSMCGVPQRLQTVPPPTEEEIREKGVVPYLDPLPRFEMSQPGNVLRIFERGGRFRPEVGIPERLEEPGRPRTRLSNRGLGTENRTDPVWVSLTKTRLLDPTLNFLGTNDHAGDYRSSGCTACHVVYANDRSRVHSGYYAQFGNRGETQSPDPMIRKQERGHPIAHQFTRGMPTSQCIVCHVHPGTTVMNSYLGFMWWDNETDGELMYPREQRYPTAEQIVQIAASNPEEAAARGLWSDPRFLERTAELNPALRHTQFADFHGHGWVFRAVFRRDREGYMLNAKGDRLPRVSAGQMMEATQRPEDRRHYRPEDLPVHYKDIHLERGMHCVDCHFKQDSHGDTKLYGEVRAAIEIACIDCHGTIRAYATLRTSGPAAPAARDGVSAGTDLAKLRGPDGRPRFEWETSVDGTRTLFQRGSVKDEQNGQAVYRRWVVPQIKDSVDPAKGKRFNPKSALAKTVRFSQDAEGHEQLIWGSVPLHDEQCAHANQRMSCIACHSSWNPSCFGCHLPQKANVKSPSLHFEGDVNKNYTAYNFQTLRDDVYMLARDGRVTGNKIGPARSSCAIHVGSYNANRESIYVQQQTISADGMSGIAFSTNVPHTVRGADGTKQCTDCHVSHEGDNNAIMAQLLMQGTNFTNFMGRYCWVGAGEHGFNAVVVTEREEPQAVIGSSLHQLAFPDYFQKHVEHGGQLRFAHEHPGKDILGQLLQPLHKPDIQSLQARGEYLYAACGEGGLRVFDIAFIDHKGFSERVTTAPVSPLGQRFYVPTRFATAVAAPCTMAPDPTRNQDPENEESAVHAMYAYLYVVDKFEGLILVGAGTLLDGNPLNNFLKRELTFNPEGLLCGARSITIVGHYAYICCDRGLVVVSLEDPKCPRVTAVLGSPALKAPTSVAVQFRYAWVCDSEGLKVLDVTQLDQPRLVTGLPIPGARTVYVARTYAYVAAGRNGLYIVDVKRPEAPFVDQVFTAGGCLTDVHDVKLGITYNSEFAYLADGANGLRVVQLTSPETPGAGGFSPRPTPRLVATYKLPKNGHAVCISEGLDRDRAVDESGSQVGVFGRVGGRPLNLQEQQKMYMRWNGVWTVSDDPGWEHYIYRGPAATPSESLPPQRLPAPEAARPTSRR